MNKKGQVFILAAVIIVVVVVSLAAIQNYVRVDKDPNEFYDLSYNIGQESDIVMNYDTYNNEDKISIYANVAQSYAKDNEVDTLLIYGNSTHLIIENYLSDDVNTIDSSISGCGEEFVSSIYLSDSGKSLLLDLNDFDISCRKIISRDDLEGDNKISIKYGEEVINFNLNKDNNFIVLLKKEDDSSTTTVVNQNEEVL